MQRVQLYESAAAATPPPYTVEPIVRFTEQQRAALEELLDVAADPYRDYGAYWDEIREIARNRAPAFLHDAIAAARAVDRRERPVLLFKNCPRGHVPELDYEAPLASKYERKRDHIAEAFHSVFAEIFGTAIVGYRSANRGDLFHDITPMRKLAFTITQRTLNTLHFHFDLPDNKVRPDWVYLLSLRNSPANIVYTPVVRVIDVLAQLDAETVEVLERPIYAQPRPVASDDIPHYGVADSERFAPGPIVVDRDGVRALMYFEGCHTSSDPAGLAAIERLREVLHRIKYDLFLEEGDFVALSNHDSMHARHVVELSDLEAHKRRWILKTWVVDDLEPHRRHFLPDRINISDE